MTNIIKQTGAYLEIVSFHLGEQEFCIDIMAIREIRGWAPVTPMPHTPPYVLGLINLRGAVIPVIDMACRLGMKMTEPSERSAIIVTDIAGKLVGDDSVEVEETDHGLLERDDAAAEGALGFRNDFRCRLQILTLDRHHVGYLLDQQADEFAGDIGNDDGGTL